MSPPGSKDRLLDFQEIIHAEPRLGIRCRRYNPKTGEFTSAENSSEDDSGSEKEHETILR